MHRWCALVLGVAVVAGCGRAPPATDAPLATAELETARLNAWLDARYEEELDFSPLTKTQLGRKDDYGRVEMWRGDIRLGVVCCRPFRLAVPE